MINTTLAGLLGYLLGSLSFGILIPRFLGTAKDIRDLGSGNAGATNVLRTQGKAQGALVLLGDLLKGFIATMIGLQLAGWAGGALAGAAALAGHCYPVFFGFKGGKGVATGAGVVLALLPQALPAMVLVFVSTIALSRYVSLGSMLGGGTLLVCLPFFRPPGPVVLFSIAAVGLILYRHRLNIQRIRNGEESRLGQGKGKPKAE